MTDEEKQETIAYTESLKSWNPGLYEIRSKTPLEVQQHHMRLDAEYRSEPEEDACLDRL